MVARLWDCILADDVGGRQVALAGYWQPKPVPEPQADSIGSEHQMIPDIDGPGLLVVQDFGMGPPYLEVNLPRVPGEIIEGIRVLFSRYESGRRPTVQFYNGISYFVCSLVGAQFRPQRIPKTMPPRYSISFRLRVLEDRGDAEGFVTGEDP